MADEPVSVEDWSVRLARLKRAGQHRDVEQLLAGMDDPDHNLRIQAIKALGRLELKEAAPQLRAAAQEDERGIVRSWAASVLADWRDPEAVDLNIRLLTHLSAHVRGHAAGTLAGLGDARDLGPLRELQPRLTESISEWVVYRWVFRKAIVASKRGAAGKEPRRWLQASWFKRTRTALCLLALVLAMSLLWIYAAWWWALALVLLLLLGWVLPVLFLLRREPLGR